LRSKTAGALSIFQKVFWRNACTRLTLSIAFAGSAFQRNWNALVGRGRPHAYQACALTSWATGPLRVSTYHLNTLIIADSSTILCAGAMIIKRRETKTASGRYSFAGQSLRYS